MSRRAKATLLLLYVIAFGQGRALRATKTAMFFLAALVALPALVIPTVAPYNVCPYPEFGACSFTMIFLIGCLTAFRAATITSRLGVRDIGKQILWWGTTYAFFLWAVTWLQAIAEPNHTPVDNEIVPTILFTALPALQTAAFAWRY